MATPIFHLFSSFLFIAFHALLYYYIKVLGFKFLTKINLSDQRGLHSPSLLPVYCSCLAYLVGWHRYLGMLELTRALRYTWHSYTNLIPGLTFMLAVSFRVTQHPKIPNF